MKQAYSYTPKITLFIALTAFFQATTAAAWEPVGCYAEGQMIHGDRTTTNDPSGDVQDHFIAHHFPIDT